MKYVGLILTIILFIGCANKSLITNEKVLPFKIFQFGGVFFFKNRDLNFKYVKKIIKTPEGVWVYPKNKCIKVVVNKTQSYKVCLRDYPFICPHIYLDKVNSARVVLRILSIFNKIAIFVEKGRAFPPQIKDLRIASPGTYEIKNPELGKVYTIFGAIVLDKNFFGPLCKALEFKVVDEKPPLPPSGGGYIVKDGKLCIMWEKSPSDDVKNYEVIVGNKEIFTNATQISIPFTNKVKEIKILTIDRAGNKSNPLILSIKEGVNK